MESLEKFSIFSKINYVGISNIWSNDIEFSTISNQNHYYNFFGSSIYNLQSSIQFNHDLQPNKKIKMNHIIIRLHPSFSENYYITCISINKKTFEKQTDNWYDYFSFTYISENELNIKMSVPNNAIIDTYFNLNEIFRFYIISKIDSFQGQANKLSTINLSNNEIFSIDIFGYYIKNNNNINIKNINVLSHNYYNINILEYKKTIIISENQIGSQYVIPMQISTISISRINQSDFVTKTLTNNNTLVDSTGRIKLYKLGAGIIENVAVQTENSSELTIIRSLRVVRGSLSIYNLRGSNLSDRVLNFVVEIHDEDKVLLPNPKNNFLHIHSDLSNPKEIFLSNTNPIKIEGDLLNPLPYSFPPILAKNNNNVLTTNGGYLYWSNTLTKLPTLNLKSSTNIKSNNKISCIESDLKGYHFFDKQNNTNLNSGFRYNSNNGIKFINNNILIFLVNKYILNTYVPLSINNSFYINNIYLSIGNSNSLLLSYKNNDDSITNLINLSLINIHFNIHCNVPVIDCDNLYFSTIGLDDKAGKIFGSQLDCLNIVCKLITNTSGQTSLDANTVSSEDIVCDFIIEKNINQGTITTGNLTFTNLISRGNNLILDFTNATKNINLPTVRFQDNVGILEYIDNNSNKLFYISDGDLESGNIILSINQNKLLNVEKITVRRMQTNNAIDVSEKITLAQGRTKSPTLIFNDNSGLYQTSIGNFSISTNNKEQLKITNNNSVITEVKKLTLANIYPTKLVVNKGLRLRLPFLFSSNNTGIYLNNIDSINLLTFVINNIEQIYVSSTNIRVRNNIYSGETITSSHFSVLSKMATDIINSINVSVTNLQTNQISISGNQGLALIAIQNNIGLSLLIGSTNCLYYNSKGIYSNNFIIEGKLTNQEKIKVTNSIHFLNNNYSIGIDGVGNIFIEILSSKILEIKNNSLYVLYNIISDTSISCGNATIINNLSSSNFNTNVLSAVHAQTGSILLNNTSKILVENNNLYFLFGIDAIIGIDSTNINLNELRVNNFVVNNNFYSLKEIILSKGSANLPSLSFVNNSGIYQSGNASDKSIIFVIGGNNIISITQNNTTSIVRMNVINNIGTQSVNVNSNSHCINTIIDNILTVHKNITFNQFGTINEPIIKFNQNSAINSNISNQGIYFLVSFAEALNIASSLSKTLGDINSNNGILSNILCNRLIVNSNLIFNNYFLSSGVFKSPGIKFVDTCGLYYFNSQQKRIEIKCVSSGTLVKQVEISASLLTFEENVNLGDNNIQSKNLNTINNTNTTNTVSQIINVLYEIYLKNTNTSMTSMNFLDGSKIYQSGNGKINFVIYSNGQNLDIFEINSSGIKSSYSLRCNSMVVSTNTVANTINTKSNLLQIQQTGNYILISQLSVNNGSLSTPSIVFKYQSGLFDSLTRGLNILYQKTVLLRLNVSGQNLRVINAITGNILTNSDKMTTSNLNVIFSQDSVGTITANQKVICTGKIFIQDGSVSTPSVIMDGVQLHYNPATKIFHFLIGDAAPAAANYFTIGNNGMSTDLGINQCLNFICRNINSNGVTDNDSHITTNICNATNLDSNVQIILANGILSDNSVRFADNSGIYKSQNNIIFSNGTSQFLIISNLRLNVRNNINILNSLKRIQGTTLASKNISSTNFTSTNYTASNITINGTLTFDSVLNSGFSFADNMTIYANNQDEIIFQNGNNLLLKMNSANNIYTPNNISVFANLSTDTIICNNINITGGLCTINNLTSQYINNNNYIYLLDNGTQIEPSLKFVDNSGFFLSQTFQIAVSVSGTTTSSYINQNGLDSLLLTSNRFFTPTQGSRESSILNIYNSVSSNTGLWISNFSKETGIRCSGIDTIILESLKMIFTQQVNILDSISIVGGPVASNNYPGIQNFYGTMGMNVFSNSVSNVAVSTAPFETSSSGFVVQGTGNKINLYSGSNIKANTSNNCSHIYLDNNSILFSENIDPTVTNRAYIMTTYEGTTKTIGGQPHDFGIRIQNTSNGNCALTMSYDRQQLQGFHLRFNTTTSYTNDSIHSNIWLNYTEGNPESRCGNNRVYRATTFSSSIRFGLNTTSNVNFKVHMFEESRTSDNFELYCGGQPVNLINGFANNSTGSFRLRSGPTGNVSGITRYGTLFAPTNRTYEFYQYSVGNSNFYYMWMHPIMN